MSIDELFAEYKKIPKVSQEPTFLEICRYPRRRFEEICSRILKFYFDPNKEHKLDDLFISSLFELLKVKGVRYDFDQVRVITEDNANGKRIDLVIYSPDFVIGIENKISASIYNPLEQYKERIEEYPINNRYNLILSLHEITKKEELEQIERNFFRAITYFDYFNLIKKNIGRYISSCDQKYLMQLFDFMQTLDNMEKPDLITDKISQFFYANSKEIDKMIELYDKNKNLVLEEQKEKISELKDKISEKTESAWWAWQGWDLGFKFCNESMSEIGIESNFKETESGSLGEFEIFITTWNLSCWKPYQEDVIAEYPENKVKIKGNRVFMHMDSILYDGDDSVLLNKLSEYHGFLKSLQLKRILAR